MVLYLLIGILVIIVGIVLIDIIPIFKDWLNRIHIGRYKDQNFWNQKISQVGTKWLSKTPKIKLTDQTRFVVLDMIKGNYTRNTIQHWQKAGLILGVSEYLDSNDDQNLKKEITRFLNNTFDSNGQWKEKPQHVDGAILAYSIMKLNFIKSEDYRRGLDYIWNLIQDHIGEDGTVQYRKSMKGYRYVDTIGFICPFLVSYGLKFKNYECIELAINQIKMYERYGMLNEFYIPSHAYKIENKAPLGLYGWGRGLGWLAIGLIDSWKELPMDHPSKKELEVIIKKFARAATVFQQKNGNWNWTVTLNESRPDSSATATLSWFMINASEIYEIQKECEKSADQAIRYLMSVTRRTGEVDFSQGDTKGLGVYSMSFNILPFTQGFSIRVINRKLNFLQNKGFHNKVKEELSS
jgi:unsaturated rhamnogalacturonyl hydrolase